MLDPYIRTSLDYEGDVRDTFARESVPSSSGGRRRRSRAEPTDPPFSRTQGRYTASFKVPDVYGVYKLVVQFFRFGHSWVDLSVETPVRPFKSSEYARFIPMQLPYYSSLLTLIIGFFVMTTAFLYSK